MSGLMFTRVGKNFFRSQDYLGTPGAGQYSVYVNKEAKTPRGSYQRLWVASFAPLVADDVSLGTSWTSAGDGMEACRQHHAATVPTIDLMAALKGQPV